MSSIKLANKVTRPSRVKVTVRPELYAQKCDSCGRVFAMGEFCNEGARGVLRGTFDGSATDDDGRGLGNMFTADVCSFECAHQIFALGGWKTLKRYASYAKLGFVLARAELTLTSLFRDEAEIRKRWRAYDRTKDASIPTIYPMETYRADR